MKLPQALKLCALAIAAVTAIVYIPSLKSGFLEWDDGLYVTGNFHIQRLDAEFVRWALLDFHAANWHPVTWLSHALDYAAWGTNPAGHHLTNLLLHAMVTSLVTLLTFRIITTSQEARNRQGGENLALRSAALTGLIFGLHPLHVESVAWVAERKDLLCALFYLLCLNTYIRSVAATGQPMRIRTYLATLGLFLLALASKPMAVSLPLVLLILDWYPLRRFATIGEMLPLLREKIPFFLLGASSALITLFAQKSGTAIAGLAILPIGARLATALAATGTYLGKMFLPVDLSPFYPYSRHITLLTFTGITALAAVAVITVWSIRTRANKPYLLAAWGYYLVTLLPVIGIIQIGSQSMADRYTYLPSIAPFLLAAVFLAAILGKAGKYPAAGLLARGSLILLMVTMAWATVRQIGFWKDGTTLWSRVIERYRGEEKELLGFSLAYNNRGIAFDNSGRRKEALADFSRAIELGPKDIYYLNRGNLYLEDKEHERAFADYSEALRLNPSNSSASYNIASIYSLENRADDACRWLSKSIAQGYTGWDFIRQDPYLDNIRNSPCYREIMAGK